MIHGIFKKILVMGTSLAVVFANLWLKHYETALMRDILFDMFATEKDFNATCPECKKEVTFGSKL